MSLLRLSGKAGGPAIILSLIALVFSAISLYETILKKADLDIYLGSVIHYGKDILRPEDAFILPLTITNSGAEDAVIVEFRLAVRGKEENATWTRLTGLYSGTNPRTDKPPFIPVYVPGHGSYRGVVLFKPEEGAASEPMVTDNQEFSFCLLAKLAQPGDSLLDRGTVPEPSTSFEAKVTAFSREDLATGKTIALRVHNRSTVRPAGGNTDAPAECIATNPQ
jgi:hypothetical protein